MGGHDGQPMNRHDAAKEKKKDKVLVVKLSFPATQGWCGPERVALAVVQEGQR